jgi:hypothetical protein
MSEQTPTFDVYAIVELFGHARIAGRVSEQVIAGQGFLRVDVPDLQATKYFPPQQGFSRFYGPGAIYSITPVSKEIATQAAQIMRLQQVNAYMTVPQLEAGPELAGDEEENEGDDDF